jgi:CRISPR-associated protein Cmr6
MGANIGWLFNKDYFKDIDYANLDNKKNEDIIKKKVQNIINTKAQLQEIESLGNIHFKATTTYPGLLLGSGNAHELPSLEGQAILGFAFDYTTGLPTIAGSSIKGVLRSAFKHSEYIQELLGQDIDVEKLEDNIFNNGDIFFDAQIISYGTNILGDDYLTPHGDDPLKNPIPLRFIKVMPNVTFRFDFNLSDGIIPKDKKRKLFENILEDLGLGAKTNVGYGKFESFSPFKTQAEKEQEEREENQRKEREAKEKALQEEKLKEEKAQKAKQGVELLHECKNLPEAFKLLKDSFGKVPKPTSEQKEIIQEFYNKQKNLSKSDEKVFKKYLK